MSISGREDRLQKFKDDHYDALVNIATLLSQKELEYNPEVELIKFHKSGVDLFNEFERTLDEYGLSEYDINDDVAIRKSEDAINIIETIIEHWKTVRLFCDANNIKKPIPSITSYATLQRIIKYFHSEKVDEYRKLFQDNNLPIYGFDNSSEHSGWKLKTSIRKIPTIVGAVFIMLSIIIAFVFTEMNGNQYLVFRLLLSSGFMLIIYEFSEGIIKVKMKFGTKLVLSATGGIALFVLIYFMNPPVAP